MDSDLAKEAGSATLKEYGQFFKKQFLDFECLANGETNKTFLPIQITMDPNELVPVIELVSSDNTLMTKVLGVLTSLCAEVVHLKKEAFQKYVLLHCIICCFNSYKFVSYYHRHYYHLLMIPTG